MTDRDDTAPLIASDDLMDRMTRLIMAGVDMVVLNKAPRTQADHTRVAVQAAFESALANGLIRLVPEDEWPEFIRLDPPHRRSA